MRTPVLLALLFLLSLAVVPAHGQVTLFAYRNWCQVGGQKVNTSNLLSVTKVQASYPQCTVTVYATGTSTKSPIFSTPSGTTLGNPFTAQTDAYFIFYAATGTYDVTISGGGMPAPKTFQSVFLGGGGGGGAQTVIEVNATPTTPVSPVNFVDSATVTWTLSGSTISATAPGASCGSVPGDNTSTNCGYNNRVGDTAALPASVSTFGFTNGTNNSGRNVVAIGNLNAVNNNNTDDLVAIGENNALKLFAGDVIAIGNGNVTAQGAAVLEGSHIIGIGIGTLGTTDFYGPMTANIGDFIAIGNGAGSMFHSSTAFNAIAIGDGAGADWIGSTNNIIGIGNAGASDHNGSDNVVGIGNGSATGRTPSGTPPTPTTHVTEVVGLGDGAAGQNIGNNVIALGNAAAIYNAANDVIAIGEGALKGSAVTNNTDHEMVVLGHNAGFGSTGGGDDVMLGFFAGASNTGSINVLIGDEAGYQNTGTANVIIGNSAGLANGGNQVVSIGEQAGENNQSSFSNFIGSNTGWVNVGQFGPQYQDCMGYDACRNIDANGNGGIVGIGEFSSSGLHGTTANIVGVGDAAAGNRTGGHDIVGVGNGAASGASDINPSVGDNIVGVGNGAAGSATGSNMVAVGHQVGSSSGSNIVALGAFTLYGLNPSVVQSGGELIGIGDHTLAANQTGSDNIAIGNYAGSNGWTSNLTVGNANLTGSNNTWIGDFTGPNTTTQLSNSTALGYQAANDASNQIVLGNAAVSQFRVPAVKTVSGIGCLQTDSFGNITNTGSGCGGGGGSGTVTSFSAPSGSWPTWLVPTVVNPLTTPSLSVAASAIPNSALANTSISINSTTCTLGSSCTISGGAGAPGGSNTQVQFNDSGAFGGDAAFAWNKTTKVLTLSTPTRIEAGDNPDTFANFNFNRYPTTPLDPGGTNNLEAFLFSTYTADCAGCHDYGISAFSGANGSHVVHHVIGIGSTGAVFGSAGAFETAGAQIVGAVHSTGAVTTLEGATFVVFNDAAGTVGESDAINVLVPTNTGGGSLGTQYGIHIHPQLGTNFYSEGVSSTNLFDGKVTAGSIVDSGLTPGTSPICPNGTGGALTTAGCTGGATVASSETVASSATPTFSTSFNVSYNVLTANVTSFTLAAGSDGQSKTLTFCQNGTGGFTVAPPANVHGFFTVSPTASKCNSQHFNYSTAQTAWLADSAGVIGE